MQTSTKGGLSWYSRYPKRHGMVLDGSSRGHFWADLCDISMPVLFNSNNCEQMLVINVINWYQVDVSWHSAALSLDPTR